MRSIAVLGCLMSCLILSGCVTLDWQQAEQKNTRQAYSDFLAKYPNDACSDQARKALKKIDEFGRVRQLDNKADYLEFIKTYTTNCPEGALVIARLKDLSTPIQIPEALKADAAKSFAAGLKYYIWLDPTGTNKVLVRGQSNAVVLLQVNFKVFSAPGSDCPVYQSALSFVQWNEKEKEPTVFGPGGPGMGIGRGFAGSRNGSTAAALWYGGFWNQTLSGRVRIAVSLMDHADAVAPGLGKGAENIVMKPISNLILVDIDCANPRDR
jgi:hypothetical protein